MGKNNRKSANLIMQGGLMAIILLVVNSILVLRHIPLAVIWGDEGNSMYSAAYGMFSFAWLISSYGLPFAVSYLIKPRLKQGQYKNAAKIMQVAVLYATITGGVLGALLFFGSSYLMGELMLEPLCGLTLQIFSAAVIMSAWNGVLRGFFMGNGAGFPVVLSMIAEQLAALLAGLPIAKLLSQYGEKVGALLQNKAFQKSFATAGFAAGILIGATLSFVFLLFLYLMSHSYYKRKNGRDSGKGREGMLHVVYVFLTYLLPFIVYGLFVKGYILVEQIMFRQFMKDGLSMAVISEQWGCYFGKYKVFTALPIIYTMALGCTLRDKVHAFYKKEAYQHMRDVIQGMLKVIMIAIIPFAVMVGVLATPLLETFFEGQDTESGAAMLLIGFVSAIFFSAAYLLAEILWGMKRNGTLMLCGVAALVLQAGVLYLMLEIIHLDIHGVLYADILYSFCLMLFMGVAVQKRCRLRYGFLRTNIPSVIASLIMGAVLFLASSALSGMLPAGGLLILLTVLGVIVYFVLLLLLHGISERELMLLPGGKWVILAARAVRIL